MDHRELIQYSLYELAIMQRATMSALKLIIDRITFPGFKEHNDNWLHELRNIFGALNQCIARADNLATVITEVRKAEHHTPNPETHAYFAQNPITEQMLAPPSDQKTRDELDGNEEGDELGVP